jgi:predicted NBD/HSP70 family sugar kinase
MRSGTRLVRHVGWGVPAPIDGDGRILPDPYFGAKDFAIIPKLQSVIQVPVRIESEANAAALVS